MKAIDLARLAALGAALTLHACAPEPARTPKPAVPQAPPAPLTPSQPVAAPETWRDAPQTPGTWSYRAAGGQSTASFGEPGGKAPLWLSCDGTSRTVRLARAGAAPSAMPMTVITTSDSRSLSAEPVPGPLPTLVARFAANDRLLDAMAFSRGRFAIQVNGLPTLYVPAWAEVGRVIEDCR